MTALAGDRNTKRRLSAYRSLPVAASVLIYEGALVSLDSSGYARPARVSTSDQVLGRAMARANNASGSAAAINVEVEQGEYAVYGNSAGADAISRDDIGLSCYVVDDQTVALTDAGGTRGRAGRIHDVTTEGVWIDFISKPTLATVRARITDVSAASDSDIVAAPFAGRVIKVYSVLQGAITVADAVVTPKIGTTAITGAALTIAQSGSAVGDVDYAHPTAAFNVAANGPMRAATDGASTTTAILDVYFVIEAQA